MSTDGLRHATPDGPRTDWGRALFIGAIAAGVLWAIIVRITSTFDGGVPVALRLTCAAGVVCLPVAMVGLGGQRWARSSGVRTCAVAASIAAGVGILALPLALLTSGALGLVIA